MFNLIQSRRMGQAVSEFEKGNYFKKCAFSFHRFIKVTGIEHYFGSETAIDQSKALHIFLKLAYQGHASAQFNVGTVYIFLYYFATN